MSTMAPKRRILYFVPELAALSGGVLNAQVLTPARYLASQGFECLFIGAEASDEKAAQAEDYIRRTYGIAATVCSVYAQRFPYFSSVWTALRVLPRVQNLVRQFAPTHVYTRGYNAAPAARRLARKHRATCIFDVRGVAAEEMGTNSGKGVAYRFILWRELNELRKADRLACVSDNLRAWIQRHIGRDALVIPSCIDPQVFAFDARRRREIREQCGFGPDELVICYSGGVWAFQRTDEIIHLFKEVASRSRRFKFLFLSNKAEILSERIRASGLASERVTITACEHRQVPGYLSAADAGIIMRQNNIVNNVASPVKVAEYLGCGLPILLTPGIGDYSTTLEPAGVGTALDESGDMAGQIIAFMLREDGEMRRERAITFAREHLCWSSHLTTMKQLFS